jgi:glycolate oxidase iron-sulfur subunit
MTMLIPAPLREAALRELAKCNKCGFCQTNCPTYLATGVEWEVARGRLALVRAVLEGELAPDQLPGSVWSCLLCRNCRTHCPPGVEMDKVMIALRAALGQTLGISPIRALVMRGVLPKRGRLAAAATLGAVGQAMGMDRLLNLMPDVRFRAAQSFAPRLRSPGALRRLAHREGLYAGSAKAPVAVFLGCATEFGLQPVAIALGRLLRRLGIESRLVDASCCGLPALSWGDLPGAQLAVAANLQLLFPDRTANGLAAVQHVITPCASCASFLRDYPNLVKDTPMAGAAARLAEIVEPASVYLGKAGLPELLRLEGGTPDGVSGHTFHDPCHLAHYLGMRQGIRPVLHAIPGEGFREMPEADACCGGGGSYALTHPELAAAIFKRKARNIQTSGADTVSTVCPVCLLQLQRGLAREGSPVRAVHLLELAWSAIEAGDRASKAAAGPPA